MAWASLPIATSPRGMITSAGSPLYAPKAAADALVLPVDAHIIARLPSSIALAIATTIPRSLNDPVGLQPSSLKYKSGQPNSAPSRLDLISGVSPSPSVIMGVASVTGNRS